MIDVAEEKPGKILHRAALLHELLEPIPKDQLHASKKLAEIEKQEERLLLKLKMGLRFRLMRLSARMASLDRFAHMFLVRTMRLSSPLLRAGLER